MRKFLLPSVTVWRDRTQPAPGVVFAFLISVLLAVSGLSGCASQDVQPGSVDAAQEERLRNAASAALESAHQILKDAKSVGWDVSNVAPLLKRAEDAFAKGQYDTATQLAEQVQQFALTGISRQQLMLAREFADKVRGLSHLSPEHQAKLAEIDRAIAAGDSTQALELGRQLHGALKAAHVEYDVVKGDSLWGISGKPQIYADPYQWPLIYKANRDQIKDADLIYPGQKLDIEKHPAQGDVDAAVEHARHRGAWSVGEPESSDKAYLAE